VVGGTLTSEKIANRLKTPSSAMGCDCSSLKKWRRDTKPNGRGTILQNIPFDFFSNSTLISLYDYIHIWLAEGAK
jgi:hypothetical protein